MAEVYFHLGESLKEDKKWREASIAFATAHSVAPEGPRANEALAAHHYCRGQMKRSDSGDGSDEIARAREIDPEHGGAGGKARAGRAWMLYGGLAGVAAGGLFLALGLLRRRRG
jgi:hypothetical protein